MKNVEHICQVLLGRVLHVLHSEARFQDNFCNFQTFSNGFEGFKLFHGTSEGFHKRFKLWEHFLQNRSFTVSKPNQTYQ